MQCNWFPLALLVCAVLAPGLSQAGDQLATGVGTRSATVGGAMIEGPVVDRVLPPQTRIQYVRALPAAGILTVSANSPDGADLDIQIHGEDGSLRCSDLRPSPDASCSIAAGPGRYTITVINWSQAPARLLLRTRRHHAGIS